MIMNYNALYIYRHVSACAGALGVKSKASMALRLYGHYGTCLISEGVAQGTAGDAYSVANAQTTQTTKQVLKRGSNQDKLAPLAMINTQNMSQI